MKYVLKCRVCDIKSAFDTVDQINRSDWTEISAMGMSDSEWSTPEETFYQHPAFCPDHSYPFGI